MNEETQSLDRLITIIELKCNNVLPPKLTTPDIL